jgi:hypothetical protein
MLFKCKELCSQLFVIALMLGAQTPFSAPAHASEPVPATLSLQDLDHSSVSIALSKKSDTQGWEKLSAHQLLMPMLLLGAGSSCVLLSYDANGNRLAQAVTTISTTGAMWGASSFGCFIWH